MGKAKLISSEDVNKLVKINETVFREFCIDVFMSEHTPPKICRNTIRESWTAKETTYYERSKVRYIYSDYFVSFAPPEPRAASFFERWNKIQCQNT
ncbi:MAG: hypothetical protein OEX19_04025 [Gammaproteobacteria bacterium]|nr:hypothetical protein [Gammaproteobacteria bacterium]